MQAIQVNVKYIRSLRHLMASDKGEIRYYLKGVLVKCDKRGKFYVATDGGAMGVYCEPWQDNEEVQECELIIPADVVKAVKPGKVFDHGILHHESGGRYRLAAMNGCDFTFTAVDAKYPNWSRVIPTKVSCEPAHYNYDLLADFNACARDGWDARYSVEVYQNGDGPALVKNGCPHFVGVIMPMRASSSPKESPEVPFAFRAPTQAADAQEQS
jgi:hypothetical protein